MSESNEFVLKAFLKNKIPRLIKENVPEIITYDTYIAGLVQRCLDGDELLDAEIYLLTKESKDKISKTINQNKNKDGQEMLIYYQIMKTTISILIMVSTFTLNEKPTA